MLVGTPVDDHRYPQSFRLKELRHGNTTDALPDWAYSEDDDLGNLKKFSMKQWATEETQTFGYDALSRLTSAVGTGAASYNYTYTYEPDGNLKTRKDVTLNQTRTLTYGTAAQHHAHAVTGISGSMTASYSYDANGNMTGRTDNLGTFTQAFDAENRLTTIIVGGKTTTFHYDADGNRILTVTGSGSSQVKVCTPFPDYEETVPASGPITQRTSYYLAGQLIAVRVRTGTSGNGALYFAYADHLGNITALSWTGGTYVTGLKAGHDPCGPTPPPNPSRKPGRWPAASAPYRPPRPAARRRRWDRSSTPRTHPPRPRPESRPRSRRS